MKHFLIILILGTALIGPTETKTNPIDVEKRSNELKLDTLTKLYIIKTKALRDVYASDIWKDND